MLAATAIHVIPRRLARQRECRRITKRMGQAGAGEIMGISHMLAVRQSISAVATLRDKFAVIALPTLAVAGALLLCRDNAN